MMRAIDRVPEFKGYFSVTGPFRAFPKAKMRNQYAHRFAIHFPNEERSASRPRRTRPVYEI